jgi:hypothetical protein
MSPTNGALKKGQEIHMTFDMAGGVKVDAINFQGQGCEAATKVFERLYVGGSRSANRKPEFYGQAAQGQKAVQRL